MNFVRLFQPAFAPLVESGAKCQTVRPVPKRMPQRGDHISLRAWTGKPYRSKQRILREATVDRVQRIRVAATRIELDGQVLSFPETTAFAKADGFLGTNDLIGWFNFTHGLPFEGICIFWK